MGQIAPRTVMLWQCDACGKTREVNEGEAPKGFHGDALNLTTEGWHLDTVPEESFKSWYACSPRCIGPAVRKIFGIAERNQSKANDAPSQ